MKSLYSSSSILLTESVQNLQESDRKQKEKYSSQVWKILQEAYESQGGIKGSGFNSEKDMINIPFWKLDIVDDTVLAVFMYKFKKEMPDTRPIRKLVALGVSNENRDLGRIKMQNIMKMEFGRSIIEISGLMEGYVKKNFPQEMSKYILTVDDAKRILPNDDIVQIDKHKYNRKIGGEYHEKIMLGTIKTKY